MLKLISKLKAELACALARLFHRICDPQTEARVIDRRDYEYYQSERHRNVEKFLTKYLGPKL